MQFTRIRKMLVKPFENLTALEALIMWVRLISSTLIIALGIAVTVGPAVRPDIFRSARFDTRPSDITRGLFDVLKEAVEVYGSTDVNNGVGLTTSEIYVLTEYTAGQIRNVPQFITISLYGRCDISYDTTNALDKNGNIIEVRNSSIVEVCYMTGLDYLFDYRQVLSQLGLDIVLDYAYDQDLSNPLGLSTSYNEYVEILRRRKINMVRLLYAVLCLETFIIFFTIWYYTIKGRLINPFKERILTHVISLLSLAVFICGLTGIISLTWLNYKLKGRIKSELDAFGFSFALGSPWFTCLWIFAFFIIVSTLVWSGLEWCLSDVEQPYNDGTQNGILGYEAGVFTGVEDPVAYNEGTDITESGNSGAVSRNNSIGPNDRSEEVELQDIELYSSDDSEFNLQRTVKPSTAMYF